MHAYVRGFVLALAVLLAGSASATADAPRVQVFSSVSRTVAALGETFVLDAEVIVTSAGSDGIAIEVDPGGGAFELVRAGAIQAGRGTVAGGSVAVLTRRFTLRALHAGTLRVPPVTVSVGAVQTATQPHTLHVYAEARRVYAAARSVLPVAAEGDGFVRIGSAFLVAEDALVTAYHVVVGTDRVRVELPGGQQLTTDEVWAIDPVRDVAVLRVDPAAVRRAGLTPLPLAPLNEQGAAGDPAFTAGWPDGAQQPGVGLRYPTLHPGEGEAILVSSNRVRPGDSGGALLDRQGRVLGVVTSGRTAAGADLFVEDVCLATDPRPALALRRGVRPYGLKAALAVHARAGAQAHAAVLALATNLTQTTGWRAGERERQEQALRRVAAEAPHDPALQFLLGATLDQIGDRDRAAAAYRLALDGDATYFPAAYALGHHYLRTGDFAAARALFGAIQDGTPYATLAALGQARIDAAQLRYAEAEASLREVLRRDHRFAPALYLLGYCLLAQGRADEAGGLAVRLDRLDRQWAERLRLHVEQPILQPVALATLPPVTPREP